MRSNGNVPINRATGLDDSERTIAHPFRHMKRNALFIYNLSPAVRFVT
jgi:hypothetical protein